MACRKKITKIINIEGMKCQHCAAAVEAALKKIKDVKGVEIDFDAKCAKVLVFEGTSDEKLTEAVVGAGFEVTGIN